MSQGEAIDWMKMEPFVQKVMAIPDSKLDNCLIANAVKYDEVIKFRHVQMFWPLKSDALGLDYCIHANRMPLLNRTP